ncbi:MAG: hypothetical protein ACLPPF_07885 [Rhodomicrobium sp.]
MRYLAAVGVLLHCMLLPLPAKAGQEMPIGGTYTVEGINRDGSAYSGTAIVAQEGERYRFTWHIGNGDTFKGIGAREGNTVLVEWGQSYPVIYEIGDGGVLHGTWDNQRATETLTPLGHR